jgi:LacI family transcriptional regulator
MATIKDVAERAGVAPSTISKYLNGGHVREQSADAIRAAIAALDYRVNPFARGLKTNTSRSIGILLPSITAPFYGTVFMALDKIIRERGYHSLISCYGSSHGLERDNLSYLLSTGVDGLIYMPEDLSADEFRELTVNSNIPVVQVDRIIQGVATDAVLSDNADSVYRAVNLLVGQGHRRVAVITGPKSVFSARERLVGYLRALSDLHILYDDSLVISGELEIATGYQGFLSLLAAPNPPTAILSTNYDITIGVITAARERGFRIPEQIGIFGYDCVEVCRMLSPALPVVHQPEQEIGRKAAQFLIERLNGYIGGARLERLPCELII